MGVKCSECGELCTNGFWICDSCENMTFMKERPDGMSTISKIVFATGVMDYLDVEDINEVQGEHFGGMSFQMQGTNKKVSFVMSEIRKGAFKFWMENLDTGEKKIEDKYLLAKDVFNFVSKAGAKLYNIQTCEVENVEQNQNQLAKQKAIAYNEIGAEIDLIL